MPLSNHLVLVSKPQILSQLLITFGPSGLSDWDVSRLAHLMKKGKIIVPGFHQEDSDYVRSDHDDSVANNMLEMFKSNETREEVGRNK